MNTVVGYKSILEMKRSGGVALLPGLFKEIVLECRELEQVIVTTSGMSIG